MNKLKAIKYAEDFVKDFLELLPTFNENEEINIVVSNEAPVNDPNLTILKQKFIEVGFEINVNLKTGFGIVNKI